MSSEIVVVLRSVGERTVQACSEIVSLQLEGCGEVHEIKDCTFEEAHLRSVQIASKSGAKWAIFLDADVLLRDNAIPMMVNEADAFTGSFYMMNFGILDHGFAGPTFGVHLYDVRNLTHALDYEKQARKDQRPESRMVLEMWTKRHIPSTLSHTIVGLHGFEQYYRDLYRTSFVRAVKFAKQGDYLLHVCRSRYFAGDSESQDFKVILWGFVDGSLFAARRQKAPLDTSSYQKKAEEMITLLNLKEKGPYVRDREWIERSILDHRTDDIYEQNKSWLFPNKYSDIPAFDQSLGKRMYLLVKKFRKRFWS